MRTFQLKALTILEKTKENTIVRQNIPLLDGLIINREDENKSWIIEAYIEKKFQTFIDRFLSLNDILMLEVKISKETNDPALFVAKLIDHNSIFSNMNVLFKGSMIDQRNEKVKGYIENLLQRGYYGEEVMTKYEMFLQQMEEAN